MTVRVYALTDHHWRLSPDSLTIIFYREQINTSSVLIESQINELAVAQHLNFRILSDAPTPSSIIKMLGQLAEEALPWIIRRNWLPQFGHLHVIKCSAIKLCGLHEIVWGFTCKENSSSNKTTLSISVPYVWGLRSMCAWRWTYIYTSSLFLIVNLFINTYTLNGFNFNTFFTWSMHVGIIMMDRST